MTAKRLRRLTVSIVFILIAQPVCSSTSWAGKSLTEALQSLQLAGLNLVFSSNVVKATMRVEKEPEATDPRQILDELLALPHLGNDFFRALTLLPGVTSNDVSAQFHARGGRRDETQILLDGQELYDSYHLKDFDSALSVVTPDTISRIDLSTGGFPVQYGDRMAGVLDMATATPIGAPRGRVDLGILSAQAGGAGSFRQQRGSWIGQLRRGTTDYAGRIFGTDAPRYWDAFGKLEYELTPRHRLRLNLIHTDDKYEIEETVDGDFKSFQTDYRGSYLWLTHQAILGASTFLESAASITRIDRDRNGLEMEEDFQFAVLDLRDMEVLGLRQGWNHQLNLAHALRWGFELRDFDTEFVVE